MANDSRYGLDACVFTLATRKGARIADMLDTGTVCINGWYG